MFVSPNASPDWSGRGGRGGGGGGNLLVSVIFCFVLCDCTLLEDPVHMIVRPRSAGQRENAGCV
jgi:hypothetical protein